MTNSSGIPSAAYAYDPWGNPLISVPDSVGTKNKFRFTGEALDPGTQLYYLRARYYDPSVGRFVAQDPIGIALHSRYARGSYLYAVNNPSRFTDHNGLSPKQATTANLTASVATNVGSVFFSELNSWWAVASEFLLNAASALAPSLTDPLSPTDTVDVFATWGASEIDAAKWLKTEDPTAFVNSVETYLNSEATPDSAVTQTFIDFGLLPAAPRVSSPVESELTNLLHSYYDPHAAAHLTNESAFRTAFDDWYSNFAAHLNIDAP